MLGYTGGRLRFSQQPEEVTPTPSPDAPAAPARALLRALAAAGTWELDPASSSATFRVRHFWGLITVEGRFGRIAGTATVDGSGAASGRLELPVESLSTGNEARDRHLRSPEFFDLANHPAVLAEVRVEGVSGNGGVRCSGSLSANGRLVPLDFEAVAGEDSEAALVLRADVTVDRTRLGMNWSPMGMASRRARLLVTARFVRR